MLHRPFCVIACILLLLFLPSISLHDHLDPRLASRVSDILVCEEEYYASQHDSQAEHLGNVGRVGRLADPNVDTARELLAAPDKIIAIVKPQEDALPRPVELHPPATGRVILDMTLLVMPPWKENFGHACPRR